MGQTAFGGNLAARRAVQVSSPRRTRVRTRRHDLEVKFATLQKEYAELHSAIFEAAQVHRRLCAPRLVQYEDFDVASEIFAVRHLPGDFFTANNLNGRAILALGDICGKGFAAGIWTTHMVGLVSARSMVSSQPESIVAGVNRDVCLLASGVPLTTLFVATLDPFTGRLDYCNAGHPPAMLLRANGKMELLSEGGLLLGVVPNATYVRGSVKLGPGDVLLAYSDGVLESLNHAEEEFGVCRLEEEFRRATMDSAETVLFSILGAVQDFAATQPIVDDMSVVVIRRNFR